MKILTKLLPAICALMLVACVTSGSNVAINKPGAKLDRAKFNHYSIRGIASDASYGSCIYGGAMPVMDFKEIPEGKSIGGNLTIGFNAVYREMKCKWTASDGTTREEVVRMDKLLLPRFVEWEHFEDEGLVEDEPLQLGIVLFTIRIEDKQFSILRDFTVQLYGERLSETERRVKAVDVKQVIYKRQ